MARSKRAAADEAAGAAADEAVGAQVEERQLDSQNRTAILMAGRRRASAAITRVAATSRGPTMNGRQHSLTKWAACPPIRKVGICVILLLLTNLIIVSIILVIMTSLIFLNYVAIITHPTLTFPLQFQIKN